MLSQPRLSRSLPAPAGQLALHGAERLAEDRVLLLSVQVPGGARRAGEGAPGQVGARPGRDLGLPGRSPLSPSADTCVPVRVGEVGLLKGHTEA